MIKPKTKLKFFLMLIVLLVVGCDYDKYFSYNYDTDYPIIKTATIRGTVSDYFAEGPVPLALIQIGTQTTYADGTGFFSMKYELKEDEERDRLVPFIVSSNNYFTHTDSLVIYSGENPEQNISLYYGAPTILNMVLVGDRCQAVIRDYQGLQNIDKVTVKIFSGFAVVDSMSLEQTVTKNIGHYQTIFRSFDTSGGTNILFRIIVEDYDGFIDSTQTKNAASDTLLF